MKPDSFDRSWSTADEDEPAKRTTPVRVKAYKVLDAFLCSACAQWKDTGRAYEVLVSIDDGLYGATAGTVIFCSNCRGDFHTADLELDAPDMYADWRSRHPNEEEDAHDRVREANGWPPSPDGVK